MPPASPFQRGRQRYQAVHAEGARDDRRGGPRRRRRSAWSISPASAPTTAARSNRYIKSKVEAEDAIIAGFNSATILRPSVVFGPDDALFNRLAKIAATGAVRAAWSATARPGSSRSSSGDVGQAAVAVLARPDTAKSVFELGGPRVYTYREIAALVLREIDRDKPIIGVPAGLMKIAGFFAQQIARLGLIPPLTADQVELMRHDNVVRPGANTLGDLGIEPTAAGGHPADLSRPLPHRRPLQPARPGLIGDLEASAIARQQSFICVTTSCGS